jgi:hypothetical protein
LSECGCDLYAIYYLVNGTGIGLKYQLNDFIEISAGYLANDASSPLQGAGLFNRLLAKVV